MKNYCFFLLAVCFLACQNESTTTGDLTFSGKITNPYQDKVTIRSGDFKQDAQLDDDGAFEMALSGIEEGVYTFNDGRESTSLYLMPGKDVHITLDTEQFDETIIYTGDGAPASNFLAQKYLQEEQRDLDYRELYALGEDDFLARIDSIKMASLEFLDGYTDLPESFRAMQKKVAEYEILAFMGDYKDAHRFLTKNEDFEPSEKITGPLKEIPLDNEEDFVNISHYKRFVINALTNDDVTENIKNLDNIASDIIKKEVVNRLKYSMRPGADDLDVIYEGLTQHADDEEFKAELKEMYEIYKVLAKGNDSPSFNYPDTTGDMVSLEDLEGTNVYIDVWATWCGPCKAEIPHLKELEEAYRDQNIAFVSISIDEEKDKDKWLKMVAEKELKGIQLMADKDWNSDFVKAYGIQGIPRFILVDDKGKIVDADAPRPSSGDKIRDMINGLKIKA